MNFSENEFKYDNSLQTRVASPLNICPTQEHLCLKYCRFTCRHFFKCLMFVPQMSVQEPVCGFVPGIVLFYLAYFMINNNNKGSQFPHGCVVQSYRVKICCWVWKTTCTWNKILVQGWKLFINSVSPGTEGCTSILVQPSVPGLSWCPPLHSYSA